MKQIWRTLQIITHIFAELIKHPRRPGVSIANPTPINQSKIPWWGSMTILLIGITSWCISSHFGIHGLDEAARAMVYLSVGNIFGMSMQLAGKY